MSFIISEDYNSPLYASHEFVDHSKLAPVYSLLDQIHTSYIDLLKKEGIINNGMEKGKIVHLAYGGTEDGYEGKGLIHWLTAEVLDSFINKGFERAIGVNTSHICNSISNFFTKMIDLI